MWKHYYRLYGGKYYENMIRLKTSKNIETIIKKFSIKAQDR